jgi:hypothetical protein
MGQRDQLAPNPFLVASWRHPDRLSRVKMPVRALNSEDQHQQAGDYRSPPKWPAGKRWKRCFGRLGVAYWQRGAAYGRGLAYAEAVTTAHVHSVPAFLHPAYSAGPAPAS